MPLGRTAQQIGPPDEQVAREAFRGVDVLGGKCQIATLELVDHVGSDPGLVGGTGLFCLGHDVQWVLVEVRSGWQPTEPLGHHVVVHQLVALVLRLRGGRQDVVRFHLFVPPLVGMQIPVGGAVHVARGTVPVETEGDGCPAGLRAQLLLTHVVGPAASRLPHAAADVQQVHDGPVVHVVVVPVVDGGTQDNHRLAPGLGGILRKLMSGTRQVLPFDAGDLLGPGGGVGHRFVVI